MTGLDRAQPAFLEGNRDPGSCNGAVQDGSDAVITPATPRSSQAGGDHRPVGTEGSDQFLQQHMEDARQLASVLRLCIEKDVPPAFL